MGRADNRRTGKSIRRKAQRRKKMRLKRKIGLGKAKKAETKKLKARTAATVAAPVVAPVATKTTTRKSAASKEKETPVVS